ncbi:kinase-like protein [Backusella circina FSU 941]|nr:kinase-like protein [Backusella circina FSU 941]
MPRSVGTKGLNSVSSGSELSIQSSNVIIGGQWRVLGRIGEGSFGEVFEAEHVDTGKRYAIKREPLKMRHPQIKHESDIYNALAGGPGIPQCHWHGQHDKFDCIAIDLLGPNLSQLKKSTKRFSIETIVNLGCQMVSSIEHIHNMGLVYRDIKPDNFLFSADCYLVDPEMIEIPDDHGMPYIQYNSPTCEEVFRKWGEPHPKLYVVDYGLTTWWRDPITQTPYPETKRNYKNKIGTARYASLNVHRGKTHSRRDDLEGIGYLLLDLLFGSLPWTGIQARNSRAGWDRMRQIKEDTFMSDICAGLPQGILEFIEYTRSLRFAVTPDYELLRKFLSGSISNGEYSSIVKSPFGGHSERRWIPDVDREIIENIASKKESTPEGGQYNNNDAFAMNDMRNTLPGTNSRQDTTASPTFRRNSNNSNTPKHNNSSTTTEPSSLQKLVTMSRKKEKKIGWNSHKHDEAPWIPVTDWDTTIKPSGNVDNISWGANQTNNTWGDQEIVPEGTWASTVTKPWD